MGNTNMPSAPNAFSLPMISQKCFSAITDWTDTQFPSGEQQRGNRYIVIMVM